jgi:hypothetical protein
MQSRGPQQEQRLVSKLATADVDGYVRRLSLGDHAVLFYDDINTLARVFAAYFNGGVEANEATLFVGPSQIYDKLLQTPSIEKSSLTRPGQVAQVEIEDFYLDRGQVNTKRALELAANLIENRRRSGFVGLRILDITGMLTKYLDRAGILEYERSVGTRFNIPLSAICAYDSQEWLKEEQLEDLTQVLKCHGHGIFQGIAFPTSSD